MRLCLVADANGASDVVGHAVINLDIHVGQQKAERWYKLLQGSDGT